MYIFLQEKIIQIPICTHLILYFPLVNLGLDKGLPCLSLQLSVAWEMQILFSQAEFKEMSRVILLPEERRDFLTAA